MKKLRQHADARRMLQTGTVHVFCVILPLLAIRVEICEAYALHGGDRMVYILQMFAVCTMHSMWFCMLFHDLDASPVGLYPMDMHRFSRTP